MVDFTRFETSSDPKIYIPDIQFVVGWEAAPEGHKTKTTWQREGYRVNKDAVPKLWVKTSYKKRGIYTALFTVDQCTPKKQATPAQLAALKKAQHMAEKIYRVCQRHGEEETVTRAYAEAHPFVCTHCQMRVKVAGWSKELLQEKFFILDTETTGLDDPEIMQIAVIDSAGNVLLDTLVKPEHPERALDYGGRGLRAVDIHGITPEMVQEAPTFEQLYPRLREILQGQVLIIYNSSFDWTMIERLAKRAGLDPIELKDDYCAMTWYSAYVGDWSNYWGNYRYQALPGGDHSALGDCRATLSLIKAMAEGIPDETIRGEDDEL